jgi:hypothetical protein
MSALTRGPEPGNNDCLMFRGSFRFLAGGALLLCVCLVAGCDRLFPARGSAKHILVQKTFRGDVLKLRLPSAPFPHRGRQNGYQYEATYYPPDPHYSDSSVWVFIPAAFRDSGAVDLVFFFHGWFSSIAEAERDFDLYRQFSESGVNALLVLPELACDAPDSYGGKLEESGGFVRLVDDLLQALCSHGLIARPKPGRLVLAGHSGAYRVIAQVLLRGGLAEHIGEVYLFDALYEWENLFADWIMAGSHRFVSVNVTGSETSATADRLIGLLRASAVELTVAPDGSRQDWRRLRSRVLFLQSRDDHYGVVSSSDQFRGILSSSPALAR